MKKSQKYSKAQYRKRIRTSNYKIISHMYHGPKSKTVRCMECNWQMIRKVPGITIKHEHTICHGSFNHIRQEFNHTHWAPGLSIDKSISPSKLLTGVNLLNKPSAMLEMILCMPLCGLHHQAVTNESCKHSITLKSFKKKHWPWVIRNKTNFKKFLTKYNPKLLDQITYADVIQVLQNIYLRLSYDSKRNRYKVMNIGGPIN